MKKYLPTILILAAIVAVIGFVIFAMSRPESNGSKEVTATELEQLKIGGTQGNPASKVVLTEFGDYQCPACAAWAPYLKGTLFPAYQDKIFIVFKNLPLTNVHKNAQLAAQAAEAAALQNQFWPMHNKLYETQKEWENDNDPVGRFEGFARDLGLDVDKFKSDFTSGQVKDIISRDAALGDKLGLPGTPAFLINGVIQNPKCFEELRAAIDAALAQNQ